MALETYRQKRNFDVTAEPSGRRAKRHREPIFVVQEHHARRLHYDFRLEADGVLKSWAVPKEPTLDPSQKRLAVHVEDHPLEYAGFKGRIPDGQYGAGVVKIWDRGTYENLLADKPTPHTVSEGIAAGRLEFVLYGKKLCGRFALVRMQSRERGKDNWLLIKMKDEFARPESNGKHDPPRRTASRDQAVAAPVPRAKGPRAGEVKFTNLEKVLYPDDGITKGDVLEYYSRIAEWLLPHLRDRPATLERYPDGIGAGAAHFWQKNLPASTPDWVPRITLPTSAGKPVNYVRVNDTNTLLYLINQGVLTIHTWFSRTADLERPDFVLFDLDRGLASFADVVKVAHTLHEALDVEKQSSFVKTSGKTGLHVLVPWRDSGGYEEARAWALSVAERVAQAVPALATTERSKAARGRRVYVDVMQNVRGHHAVPPYVLRPVPGAPVSTPLTWREVTPKLDPHRFNLKTIFRRLARQNRDLMAPLLATE